MPAQAGIQGFIATWLESLWIPAFAGMTAWSCAANWSGAAKPSGETELPRNPATVMPAQAGIQGFTATLLRPAAEQASRLSTPRPRSRSQRVVHRREPR